jgi:hypothetical protein
LAQVSAIFIFIKRQRPLTACGGCVFKKTRKMHRSLRSIGLLCCLCSPSKAGDIYRLFILPLNLKPRPPRYNDRLLVYPAVRIRSSRHYFCFRGCAAVRCMVGCLLAFIKKKMCLPSMQLDGYYTL